MPEWKNVESPIKATTGLPEARANPAPAETDEPMEQQRVGIFGGTFNPVHIGHLRAAIEVAEALSLSRVELVPAARPPHKRGEGLLDFSLRLALCRRAVEGMPGFTVNPMLYALVLLGAVLVAGAPSFAGRLRPLSGLGSTSGFLVILTCPCPGDAIQTGGADACAGNLSGEMADRPIEAVFADAPCLPR